MNNVTRLLGLTLIGITTVYFSSCKSESPSGPEPTTPPKIETGTDVTAATQSISTGGGSITVNSADTLISGLTLAVPKNAYSDARTFTISYAPIKSHQFGKFFRPISPLITISNGGAYGDTLMSVTIPISLPAGSQPVAFFYDKTKGALEPIPMLSYDSKSVTIGTMHFDVSGISTGLARQSRFQPSDLIERFAQILIAETSDALVAQIAAESPQIPTGFVPGTDDWEFVNNGGYLDDVGGGQCAGQNISSLWYFFEQKKKANAPSLFHRFDSVNVSAEVLWQDNQLGYRMACATQTKLDWDSKMLEFFRHVVGAQDRWTWNSLIVSMAASKEPFLVGVRGLDADGNTVGHNLIAYAVDIPGRSISVADPNFPGNQTRRITFDGTKFAPYHSALNAHDAGIDFDSIRFNFKTATVNWTDVGALWNSVVVNRQNPGFPEYHLKVDNNLTDIYDGIVISEDTIFIEPLWSAPRTDDVVIQVYDRNGNRLAPQPPYGYSQYAKVKLQKGVNLLGIAVYGEIAPTPPSTTTERQWNDFRWYRVICSSTKISITPAQLNGKKRTSYEWAAIVPNHPQYMRYEWDFGDGTATYGSDFDSTAIHSYQNDGNYTIKLTVTDRSTYTKIGEAQATASIHSGPVIDSVTPREVSFGTTVSIVGSGFGSSQGSSTLKFGDLAPLSVLLWKDDHIIATVPEMFSSSKNYITVTVGGIESEQAYLNMKYPAITSISPDSAMPGALMTIKGTGFGYTQGNAKVELSPNDPATVVSWSDTIVTVLVPEPAAKSYGVYWPTLRLGNGYSATHSFIVVENIINTLHETNCFSAVVFEARVLSYYSSPAPPHNDYSNMSMQIPSNSCQTSKIVWDKRNFSVVISKITSTDTTITTLNGTVSTDGKVLETINSSTAYHSKSLATSLELDFKNIPLKQSVAVYSQVTYSMTGAALASHLVKVAYDYSSPTYQTHYIETDWTSTIKVPYFNLQFVKN